MKKLRILLADDHEMIREGLKMLIDAQVDMECIGEASDGRAAVRLAGELKPDIIVMDVSMPEMSGAQATEQLQQTLPNIKILALTRHRDNVYLQQLLRSGVSGYVLKQSAATELIRAIRALASGHNYLDPAITQNLFHMYVGKRSVRLQQSVPPLSERETEILRHLAWGYGNKEIAATLNISIKTVETHKATAMQKMEFKSRIDIVRYAMLKGWLQEKDTED